MKTKPITQNKQTQQMGLQNILSTNILTLAPYTYRLIHHTNPILTFTYIHTSAKPKKTPYTYNYKMMIYVITNFVYFYILKLATYKADECRHAVCDNALLLTNNGKIEKNFAEQAAKSEKLCEFLTSTGWKFRRSNL